MSLKDARSKIKTWRDTIIRVPHSALSWMTPSEFAKKSAGCQNMQPERSRLFLIMNRSHTESRSLKQFTRYFLLDLI